MGSLPQLSTTAVFKALQAELRRQQGTEYPLRPLLAIYGTGAFDVIQDSEFGQLTIVPVRSELELRAKLPSVEAKPEPTAFLVPWRGNLPLDIAVRFARRGRVLPIGPEQRLQVLTGAVADAALAQGPLATYLLRANNPRGHYAVGGGRLTEDNLWATWLKLDWGLDSTGGLSRDLLLAWAVRDGHGSGFTLALEDPAATGLRPALDDYLQRRLGALGPLAFALWEKGRGEELLALGIVCEAFAESEALSQKLVGLWLAAEFKHRFGVGREQVEDLARSLADTTPLALRLLERSGTDANPGELVVRRGVALADQWLAAEPDIAAAAAGSHRLPSAWRARQRQLGAALAQGAREPSPSAVKLAVERQRELEHHDFFKRAEDSASVRRGEMAVRLLAWLVSSEGRFATRGAAAHSAAEELAQWYAEEGGYVDWARRWARGSADDALGQGVQAVLDRVDPLRVALDERFAESLAAWHDASRPGRQLVPIDKALEQFGVAFLQQASPDEPPRKLLVLLMDGMGWAQAVELLQSMAELCPVPWAPLSWHGMSQNRVGSSPYPPVLANLPTITEVSRSAFFASKPLPPGSKVDAQADPERFAKNAKLQPFCTGAKGPRLLLRGESHSQDGSASSEALSLIRDEDRRVVGIVVNAIDSSLKGDSQQHSEWRVDSVRSLTDLLETARDCGRHVLLASDHGHVPADRLQRHSTSYREHARWRPQVESRDAIQHGERAFRGPGVYQAKNTDGAVLLTTDTLRYGSAPHAGEHGGATLAEVVAPCLLLGWDDPITETGPADSRLAPLYVPDWWHYATPSAALPPVEVPAPPPASRRRKPVPDQQLGLPGVTPPAAAPPGAPPDPFLECEMLKARASTQAERQRVTKAVRFLLGRGDVAPLDAFAQHLGVPIFRAEGIVALLTETLNVDGYEVLRFDRERRQLFLDKQKLQVQFEVQL